MGTGAGQARKPQGSSGGGRRQPPFLTGSDHLPKKKSKKWL